jgi:hypothetical protein
MVKEKNMKTINIPKQLSEISIDKMEMIAQLDIENIDTQKLRFNEMAILCDMDVNELLSSTDIEDVGKIIKGLNWFYDLSFDDIETTTFSFEHNNKTYTLVEELNELTFGQWIDLDGLIKANQDNYWTMTRYIIACISKESNQSNPLNTMKELEARANEFKSLTLDKVFNYTSYFFKKKRKWNQLSNLYSQLHSPNQSMDISTQATIKSGAGQGFFMTLLNKTLLSMIMLIGWVYMKFSHFFPSKMKGGKLKNKLRTLINNFISQTSSK